MFVIAFVSLNGQVDGLDERHNADLRREDRCST